MESVSFSTDARLFIKSWGKDIVEYTGKTFSEVKGKKYFEVLPRIFTGNADAVQQAMKKGKTLSLKEYGIHCLSGQLAADITVRPLKSRTGTVSGAKVTITPTRYCEAMNRLRGSQKLIEIGKMASTLAHGVRNPLNAIKGAVVYLGERFSGEPTLVEFTTLMESEISKLDNFISKFLSTSLSEAAPSATDINALLKRLALFVSLQLKATGITASFEYGDVPPVMVNGFHLEQAVLNVINNSIEAMGKGGRLGVTSMTEQSPRGMSAIIEISDTGPGMATGNPGGKPLTGKKGGRGFGLFITREILQYYGGSLQIISRKGTGTTVRLSLPSGG